MNTLLRLPLCILIAFGGIVLVAFLADGSSFSYRPPPASPPPPRALYIERAEELRRANAENAMIRHELDEIRNDVRRDWRDWNSLRRKP